MLDSMNKLAVDKAIHWRYAVQKFDLKRKISDAEFEVLMEALRLTPSSYGLQPWKFIVVKNPEVREELKKASYFQAQVTEASHFVAIAYKGKMLEEDVNHYIQYISSERKVGLETLEKYKNGILRDLLGFRGTVLDQWAINQTYIAMGFVLQAAAVMGIDTCPMEGLKAKEYDRLLGLEGTGYHTVTAIAFGYRDPECKMQAMAKIRFPKEHVIKTV